MEIKMVNVDAQQTADHIISIISNITPSSTIS